MSGLALSRPTVNTGAEKIFEYENGSHAKVIHIETMALLHEQKQKQYSVYIFFHLFLTITVQGI